jgi:hypothetical protein
MYCPKCGAENLDEARFCGKCAAPMPTRAAPPGPPAPPWGSGTGRAPEPVVPPGLKLLIGIGSVVMPPIGLVLGIVYMVDANPKKKAAGKLWLLLAGVGVAMYCVIGAILSSIASYQPSYQQ